MKIKRIETLEYKTSQLSGQSRKLYSILNLKLASEDMEVYKTMRMLDKISAYYCAKYDKHHSLPERIVMIVIIVLTGVGCILIDNTWFSLLVSFLQIMMVTWFIAVTLINFLYRGYRKGNLYINLQRVKQVLIYPFYNFVPNMLMSYLGPYYIFEVTDSYIKKSMEYYPTIIYKILWLLMFILYVFFTRVIIRDTLYKTHPKWVLTDSEESNGLVKVLVYSSLFFVYKSNNIMFLVVMFSYTYLLIITYNYTATKKYLNFLSTR